MVILGRRWLESVVDILSLHFFLLGYVYSVHMGRVLVSGLDWVAYFRESLRDIIQPNLGICL